MGVLGWAPLGLLVRKYYCMTLIYKHFNSALAGANDEIPAGSTAVPVPGGRGYERVKQQGLGAGVAGLYLDDIHFEINAESWYVHQDLRERIATDPALQGRVYAGCAGQVNLDYIAASKAPAALLYDINPLQTLFWQACFDRLAQTPDRVTFARSLRPLAEEMYYKIRSLYGPHADLPLMRDPAVEGQYNRDSAQSPFRGMSYGRMGEWAEYRLRDRFGAAVGSWAAEDERYAHLHVLAKNDALAAVTVDVRDHAACRRIGERLRTAHYDVIDDEGVVQGQRTGAAVGFLYRSNVGHYMKWSRAEIAARQAEGIPAHDFSGLPANVDTYRQMCRNLRYWQDPAGGHMIASDRHSGGQWGQFVPRLRAVRPFKPLT